MQSFFVLFADEKVVETHVLGNVERLMLRNPDIVIRIFDRIFASIKSDLGVVFREKFADPLLSECCVFDEK